MTDDDMFAALDEKDLAIGVGANRTRARAHLAEPSSVHAFLEWIRAARSAAHDETLPSFAALAVPIRPRVSTKLLVISNRTPPITQGRHRSVGGLVSALEPALQQHAGIWLGWSGGVADGERRLTIDDSVTPTRASFELPTAWRDHYYAGFCNRALWPLFHGFPGRVRYCDADWNAYVAANEEFARRAAELVDRDGTIWVHDYHLLLVAQSLRAQGFTGSIGLFIHIPFPHGDLFDTLPWAAELLDAMRAFDLVGFHTQQGPITSPPAPRLAGHRPMSPSCRSA